VKLWLEVDGEAVIGTGRLKLLLNIDRFGSITKAADDLNMSYRTAWGKIKDSEERLNCKLVATKVGGSSGGGAELTTKAKDIIAKYQEYERLINQKARELFEEKIAGLF
jgi:molybdate transport system regulatory protein